MKIGIIGAGNVGTQLAEQFEINGLAVTDIYSRSYDQAQALAARTYEGCAWSSPDLRRARADIFIACVPDRVLPDLHQQLRLPEQAILAHTSGSVPLTAISQAHMRTGVFYPLQTMSKSRHANLARVPICLEASDETVMEALSELAWAISTQVYNLRSDERLRLHLAAVMACNFSNHLYTIADLLLQESGLDLDILRPLLKETMTKALEMGPLEAQTGPARRQDQPTMDQHAALLAAHPHWQHIYQVMSASITEMYMKNQSNNKMQTV